MDIKKLRALVEAYEQADAARSLAAANLEAFFPGSARVEAMDQGVADRHKIIPRSPKPVVRHIGVGEPTGARATVKDRLRAALSGEPQRLKDISRRVGVSANHAGPELRRLVKERRAVKVGRGKYRST